MGARPQQNIRPQVRQPIRVAPAQRQVVFVEEFKADPSALNMLIEMGYPEEDAIIALKVTSNNLENACTFIMNNPNPA